MTNESILVKTHSDQDQVCKYVFLPILLICLGYLRKYESMHFPELCSLKNESIPSIFKQPMAQHWTRASTINTNSIYTFLAGDPYSGECTLIESVPNCKCTLLEGDVERKQAKSSSRGK